jgi:hypothetical protein
MRQALATIGLIGLLLAACTSGTGTNSVGSPEVMSSSSGGVLAATPSASAAGSAVAMSCTDAFASVDVSSITSLADVQDKLDTTIQACPTVDDWVNAAKTVLPNVDLSQARDFLKTRCGAAPAISSSALCVSVSS